MITKALNMLSQRRVWLAVVVLSAAGLITGAWLRAQTGANDELVFRLESFNISLDPAFISDTQSRRLVDMLNAKLVSSNPNGEMKPELAERWTWVAPTILQMKLHQGYTFSNGKTVTATDASYSLCRLVQPGAPYSWLFSNLRHEVDAIKEVTNCTGLRAIDDLTLEIEVVNDPGRLLPALASSTAAIVAVGAQPGEFGVVAGAGAYRVERIAPNSRVVLKARPGGPLDPKAKRIIFQLVQDDAAAATLFKAGKLAALEIANPTLHKLLIDANNKLAVPGRFVEVDAHQIRLLIFNRSSIAKTLGLSDEEAQRWTLSYTSRIDVAALAQRFAPLAIPMRTSYFPARKIATRPPYSSPIPKARGKLQVISENDPYSDAIAAGLPSPFESVEIGHVGLEKSLLISRLLQKDYDVASISLEAMMNDPAYWLAFFQPGSPFTVFGDAVDGLDLVNHGIAADRANAAVIDARGNWFVLFQERRLLALQPGIIGESFLATGLANYVTIGAKQ